MRRLGILVAAMIIFAVAAAPLQASGAVPCPCGAAAAAADCPCHTGNCDLLGPPAACHCPLGATLFVSSAPTFKVETAHDQWRASPTHRLRGMKTVPPLRPPILD